MPILASTAIPKIRIPKTEEPITRGQVIINKGHTENGSRPVNALHTFKGVVFRLIVAGQISMQHLDHSHTIDELCTWAAKRFGIRHPTLDLISGYLFYHPRSKALELTTLLATKLIANVSVAYLALRDQHAANSFSARAYDCIEYPLWTC